MRDDIRIAAAIDAPCVAGFPSAGRATPPKRRFRTYAPALLILIGLAVGMLGSADGSTFEIAKLYSNQSGDLQYIELHDTSTDGKVGPLSGSVITARHGDWLSNT